MAFSKNLYANFRVKIQEIIVEMAALEASKSQKSVIAKMSLSSRAIPRIHGDFAKIRQGLGASQKSKCAVCPQG